MRNKSIRIACLCYDVYHPNIISTQKVRSEYHLNYFSLFFLSFATYNRSGNKLLPLNSLLGKRLINCYHLKNFHSSDSRGNKSQSLRKILLSRARVGQ